jgi:hypothetical protein
MHDEDEDVDEDEDDDDEDSFSFLSVRRERCTYHHQPPPFVESSLTDDRVSIQESSNEPQILLIWQLLLQIPMMIVTMMLTMPTTISADMMKLMLPPFPSWMHPSFF